jgi:hypothetical protein
VLAHAPKQTRGDDEAPISNLQPPVHQSRTARLRTPTWGPVGTPWPATEAPPMEQARHRSCGFSLPPGSRALPLFCAATTWSKRDGVTRGRRRSRRRQGFIHHSPNGQSRNLRPRASWRQRHGRTIRTLGLTGRAHRAATQRQRLGSRPVVSVMPGA